MYNRWSATNREAQYKGISLTQTTDKSSRFVMDENTISGESFNIGYEFTQPFVKRMGLSVLNIQAIMNDLFRCSSVKSERGIDYPLPARFLSHYRQLFKANVMNMNIQRLIGLYCLAFYWQDAAIGWMSNPTTRSQRMNW